MLSWIFYTVGNGPYWKASGNWKRTSANVKASFLVSPSDFVTTVTVSLCQCFWNEPTAAATLLGGGGAAGAKGKGGGGAEGRVGSSIKL